MRNKKIKLLIFITDFDITGGAQMMLLNLLSKIDRKRFEIVLASLASLKGSQGFVTQELKRRGEKLYELKMRGKWDLLVLHRFYKLLKTEKPDILYSLLYHPNMIARVIGKFICKIPVVINGQRGADVWRRFYHILLDRFTFRWCDAIIALSHAVKKRLSSVEKLEPNKIIVIHNGIDWERYQSPKLPARKRIFDFINRKDQGEILIGSVCRLHYKKGLKYAIEAVSAIANTKDKVIYVIVGEGKEKNRLARLIKCKGMAEKIFLVGEKAGIEQFLAGFDIFVLPSIDEGFGNVFLEVQAAGVPIIATKEGGIPEAVADGKTGILVEKKNVIQLIEALEALVDSADLRKKMGKAGRERIKQEFSIERMARENEKVFETLYYERNYN